jgi:hypothetical protein
MTENQQNTHRGFFRTIAGEPYRYFNGTSGYFGHQGLYQNETVWPSVKKLKLFLDRNDIFNTSVYRPELPHIMQYGNETLHALRAAGDKFLYYYY